MSFTSNIVMSIGLDHIFSAGEKFQFGSMCSEAQIYRTASRKVSCKSSKLKQYQKTGIHNRIQWFPPETETLGWIPFHCIDKTNNWPCWNWKNTRKQEYTTGFYDAIAPGRETSGNSVEIVSISSNTHTMPNNPSPRNFGREVELYISSVIPKNKKWH